MTVNAACDCSAWCDTCVRWSKYSTPLLTAMPVLRVCAMFEGLTRVLPGISMWFSCQFPGFHVANRAVTFLLLLRRCMKCFSVFCSEYSRARSSIGRSCQVIDSVSQFSWRAWPISCSCSTVARCALVRNSLQTSCLQWANPLSHYRHNAGEGSTKVGHEINIRWSVT